MGKRGPKPKSIIDLTWRPELAYAIGLLATDGCLGRDGLWVDLTSNDKEQLLNFSKCLGVDFKIGSKSSGHGNISSRIQFKNKTFYDFLVSIGLTPKKSLTIGPIKIPKEYFFDFLRGSFDGDGCFYSYWDKRWRSSHMFYIEFLSGSKKHVDWIQKEISKILKVEGHITKGGRSNIFKLKYAKKEALEIIQKMYYTPEVVCLTRKKLKIVKALKVEEEQQKNYS